MEGRYRMIHGSEDAVLWLQLSAPLSVGMFGDLRVKEVKIERKTGRSEREDESICDRNRGLLL